MSYSAPAYGPFAFPGNVIDNHSSSGWLPQYNPAAETAWPSANLAVYVPLRVPRPVTVRKLWYASGATTGGNIDIGLFTTAGAKIVSSGATTKAGEGATTVDVTDTFLARGTYYVGLASDSATATFYGLVLAVPLPAGCGVLSEESAYTLPATATFAVSASTLIPRCGIVMDSIL